MLLSNVSLPPHCSSIQASSGPAHNGPICGTCRVPYIGVHECDPEDIDRLIDELVILRNRAFDRVAASGEPVELVGRPRVRLVREEEDVD